MNLQNFEDGDGDMEDVEDVEAIEDVEDVEDSADEEVTAVVAAAANARLNEAQQLARQAAYLVEVATVCYGEPLANEIPHYASELLGSARLRELIEGPYSTSTTGPIELDAIVSRFAKICDKIELLLDQPVEAYVISYLSMDIARRRDEAIKRLRELETYLTDEQLLGMMKFMWMNLDEADLYLCVYREGVRRLWVKKKVAQLGLGSVVQGDMEQAL